MKSQIVVFLLGCLFASSLAQSDWTEEDLDALKLEIADFISGYEERAPQLLRYSFHSCVGGCDGCINLADSGNGGLEVIYEDGYDFYNETMPFGDEQLLMSYADFLALAGIVAVDYTIGLSNEECQGDPVCDMKPSNFAYVYGREDCETVPALPEDVFVGLPGGFLDHEGMLNFYATTFALDSTEAAALNGAHTIGSMHRDGSGYTGEWKEGTPHLHFNNQYYAHMVSEDLDWTQFNAESDPDLPEKWQWLGTDKTTGETVSTMLPSDISLVQDLQISDDGGHSSCEFLECDYAPDTTNLSEFFSNQQDVWLDIFCVAYDKMTATVGDAVKLRKPIKK